MLDMKRMLLVALFFLVFLLIGPIIKSIVKRPDLKTPWYEASRESAGVAPDPSKTEEAVIQAYSADAFHWRGAFSVHTWLAVKPKGAKKYTVYQSVGWNIFRHQPAVLPMKDLPDRYWYSEKPKIFLNIRGNEAEKLISKIQQAVDNYPHKNGYAVWPGPNSNTFIAYIGRSVPELGLNMPSNAIGKDYLVRGSVCTKAPSGTGFQCSLSGLFGILLAVEEGLEINLLGLVYGVDFKHVGVKIPGFGCIGLFCKS